MNAKPVTFQQWKRDLLEEMVSQWVAKLALDAAKGNQEAVPPTADDMTQIRDAMSDRVQAASDPYWETLHGLNIQVADAAEDELNGI